MKKARVIFLVVAEDEIPDGAKELYSVEEQAQILRDIVKKGILGGKECKTEVRYASREILEDDVPLESEILIHDEPSGIFECFHCGHRSVIWDNDFMFEDYGYSGNGIVQCCHCTNCGADIQYMIPLDDEEDGVQDDRAGTDTAEH